MPSGVLRPGAVHRFRRCEPANLEPANLEPPNLEPANPEPANLEPPDPGSRIPDPVPQRRVPVASPARSSIACSSGSVSAHFLATPFALSHRGSCVPTKSTISTASRRLSTPRPLRMQRSAPARRYGSSIRRAAGCTTCRSRRPSRASPARNRGLPRRDRSWQADAARIQDRPRTSRAPDAGRPLSAGHAAGVPRSLDRRPRDSRIRRFRED